MHIPLKRLAPYLGRGTLRKLERVAKEDKSVVGRHRSASEALAWAYEDGDAIGSDLHNLKCIRLAATFPQKGGWAQGQLQREEIH